MSMGGRHGGWRIECALAAASNDNKCHGEAIRWMWSWVEQERIGMQGVSGSGEGRASRVERSSRTMKGDE